MAFCLTFFLFFFPVRLSPFLLRMCNGRGFPSKKKRKNKINSVWRLTHTTELCFCNWSSRICDHLSSVSFLVGFGLPFLTVWLMRSCLYPCLQADHLTRRGKPLPQQESLEIELPEEKPAKRSIITVEELTEIERLEDLDTCMVRHIPQAIWLSMQISGRKMVFKMSFGNFKVSGNWS